MHLNAPTSRASAPPPIDRTTAARTADALLLLAAAAGVGLIVAAALGALPGGAAVAKLVPRGDMVLHALVYGTLAAAVAVLTPRAIVRIGPRRCPLALLVVLLIALAEEALQLRDPSRQATFSDAAANAFGVLVLAPLVLAGRRRLHRWRG